jgi:FlaA1/EpsC-like NDP-sugar epimerase
LIKNLIDLPRSSKQIILLLIDTIILIAVLLASFSLRLGYWFLPSIDLLLLILCSPFIAIPIFIQLGLYRTIIRYIGLDALWVITKAASLYALIWGALCFMSGIQGIPRSVILINWLLTILVISNSRMVARWLLLDFNIKNNSQSKNVVIYGAGAAGRQLLNALSQSSEYNPIALIDDSADMYRKKINGIHVISPNNLERLINHKNIDEVLLAMPSISRIRRREIIDFLEPFPFIVRSLPSVTDIAQGKIKIDDLLKIDIRDLLGREQVQPNEKLLEIKITDKIVMVTGAGGSIGSELSRQILHLKPKKLILFEISESSLYLIEQELLNLFIDNLEIIPIIGSTSDKLRVENILNYYKVQTIYHAAAYKHVPLVEFNPSQGVLNNSIGTLVLAEAAIISNVETFVLISTDKAVRPTSTMGVAKRVSELVLQALAKKSHNTCFTMVRFGNVLDSSGSVIPLFKKQIEAGGPITVTDVNMVRFFMTITEAVELVIQAGAMAHGGDIFVLDMGEPISINDLAIRMIQLSGLRVRDKSSPDGDIEITYTGIRPGEKLYEELLVGENVTETENELIMRATEKMIEWDLLKPLLDELQDAAIIGKKDLIRKSFKKIVPEYNS